ncbi:putative 3-deoxy-D-manno-octulosonic acid transferase, mitochondrial isoform X1 [Canna indica]|uniref:lipid IVA 3-deoxy-D-manno-octulosonic acid transferase n=1 Tax=Canna indica TaxID=4628 RepID=A0AAQ3K7M0_9LILI|nr:putative 3-deoxy-D-manno-octulosonic acid transferase, mitochondrial isoform X1 [Canna indica]
MVATHASMAARGKLVYGLYRAVTRVAVPIIYAHVQWRRLRGLEHPSRWPERFGRPSSPRPSGPLLWFHAVSLGEGLSAIPVIKHCVSQHPNFVVLMTTTTLSAFEVIKDQLPGGVIYQLAPLDLPTAVDKFLGYWDPVAIFLMESELWPNLIVSASKKRIPVALLNARMSCKSFERWSRPLAQPLISLMLSKISFIAPLSTLQAIRFQLLHVSPHVIHFAGDLKYAVGDFNILAKDVRKINDLQLQLADRHVWMAASIHEGEEEVMFWVHKELIKMYPNLLLILVPRHPQHAHQIALELKKQGLNVSFRSRNEIISPSTNTYVVDTLGELRVLYRVTPVAVIGGSFLPGLAGHNVSEAAAAGCAVLTGPHVGHFSHMLAGMIQAASSSVLQVGDKYELLDTLKNLLGDAKSLEAHCIAAKHAFSNVSKGVVERAWKLASAHVLEQAIGKSDDGQSLVTLA